METHFKDIATIIGEAIEIVSPAERESYLEKVCGDDAVLRERVEQLLEDHARAGDFLEVPLGEFAKTASEPKTEGPGDAIGPYKLLEQIGEGGFGIVYLAEQQSPVRRRVALKIIKPGMDTKQVLARFRAELQALALMDHPNIARVLDGGSTNFGRPYFVLELVRGVPITDYCDQNQLAIHERLQLFVQVCNAVQHAHQKGIIHRDIKPSNILIAIQDGRPVPKVIDFGVAKAINQQLTQETIFTRFAEMIGTPLYMSPEQAEISSLDIDTRSDIYSLGVLLYELLTGSTPFEKERLKQAAFDEIRRIIREEEPPKPSTRISSLGEINSTVAARRHADPRRLGQLMRGELDWIVMKTLEKDRIRRYETANGLAMDLQRYLTDEPVLAGPPSAFYRFRKFARRNKAALLTASMVALAILLAAVTVGWSVRDRAAREEQLASERTARQARVSGQLELILDEVARLEQAEKWSDALTVARRAEPALVAGEAAADIQARARQALADLELVRRLDEIRTQSGTVWVWWSAFDTSRDSTETIRVAQTEQDYTELFREAGIDVDALSVQEASERITARGQIAAAVLPALDDWVVVRSLVKDEAASRRLVDVLHAADPDPWRQRVREALIRKDWPALGNLMTSADLERQPPATWSFLSGALRASRKPAEQELVLRRAQWKYPADFWINHRLGVDLVWRQSPQLVLEGIGYLRAAVALRPENAHSMMNLGNGYLFLRDFDQAIACYRKALDLKPDYQSCHSNLGIALSRKGDHAAAIASFEKAIQLKPDFTGTAYTELSMIHSNRPDTRLRDARKAAELADKAVQLEPQVSNSWTALGIARYRQSRWQEARTAFERSMQLASNGRGGTRRWGEAIDRFFLAMSDWQLGQKDEARKSYDQAVEWMQKNQPQESPLGEDTLRVIRNEAEELLKITDEKPTKKSELK